MSLVAATATGRTKTPPQTLVITRAIVDQYRSIIDARRPATYETYRAIRRHPTVALARAMTIAPIVVNEWSIETDETVPDSVPRFLSKHFLPQARAAARPAAEGCTDYGWSPFEVITEALTFEGLPRVGLRRLKPLLVDMTEIMIYDTGDFAGYRQTPPAGWAHAGTFVDLYEWDAMHVAQRVEADNHYGQSLLENVRATYDSYQLCEQGARRYDHKIAGEHWVVYYPHGTSVDATGTTVDNATIATQLLDSLRASGHAAMPVEVKTGLDQLDSQTAGSWRVELVSSSGHQHTFAERLRYLDAQLVRGLLQPERAILEGQFGTKAEAGVHQNLGLLEREAAQQDILAAAQTVLDRIVRINYGDGLVGRVRVTAAPLHDRKVEFLRTVWEAMLRDPITLTDTLRQVDRDTILDVLGIPKVKAVADQSGAPADTDALLDAFRSLVSTADEPAAQ